MYRLSSILFFILVFIQFNQAQQSRDSEIIQSAIEDEIARCMDSLKSKDSSPAFMDFGLTQTRSYNVLSTLGGVVFEDKKGSLDFSSRLLAGSYHISDENFNPSGNHDRDFLALPTAALPEKPEYWPIRMVLWSSAERLFNSACKTYLEKMNILTSNHKTADDYILDDFSKAPVVVLSDNRLDSVHIDAARWQKLSKTLSAQFKDYPDIVNSIVYIGSFAADYYFINSEGTKVRYPLQLTRIVISAVARLDDKSSASSSISYIAVDETHLPDTDSLLSATHKFADQLVQSLDLPMIEEEYDGPVLYEDLAASELFQQALFTSREFNADREQMSDSRNAFYLPDKPSANSFEKKIDKLVVDKSLSIYSLPKLKSYKNIGLVGSFTIDAEGVIPPDTLILVKDGKLKNLFNDRVPTFNFPQSNGHKRVFVNTSGISYALGPGVIKIKCTSGLSRTDLKRKLLDKAIEKELDYAYIIRKNHNNNLFYSLYRVDVKTGQETLIRYFSLPSVAMDDLKEDVWFSSDELIQNTTLGRDGILSHEEGDDADLGGGNDMPVSFITPGAVLIEKQNILIQTERDTYKTPVVTSPLKK